MAWFTTENTETAFIFYASTPCITYFYFQLIQVYFSQQPWRLLCFCTPCVCFHLYWSISVIWHVFSCFIYG